MPKRIIEPNTTLDPVAVVPVTTGGEMPNRLLPQSSALIFC